MANPAIVTCTKDTWVKVITNKTAGFLKRIKTGVRYLETYRMTGEAAPTDKADACELFAESPVEQVSHSAAIDVYVMAVGEAGTIRVDA